MGKDEETVDVIIEDLFNEQSPDISKCDSRELLSLFDVILLLKKDEQFDPSFKINLETKLEKSLKKGTNKDIIPYNKFFWKSILQVFAILGITKGLRTNQDSISFDSNIDPAFIKAYAVRALNFDSLLYNYSSVGYWFPKFISALQ
jgi:hypothetical protein